jgi:hypothetical protein
MMAEAMRGGQRRESWCGDVVMAVSPSIAAMRVANPFPVPLTVIPVNAGIERFSRARQAAKALALSIRRDDG